MSDGRLNVFVGSSLIGVIRSDPEGRMSFRYASTWLENPDRYGISASLPLSSDGFSPDRAHPFFTNLLPEGPVREQIARAFGISSDNDFELLSLIGGECAGALWIGPGEPPPTEKQHYTRLSESDLHERLMRFGVFASIVHDGKVRLSLAGAQDKLPVRMDEGDIMLPEEGAPSTHILKFPSRDYRSLPQNEVLVTGLARHAGIRTATTRLLRVGDIDTCLVSRYDRMLDGVGRIVRLHQEDMCQVMGLPPIRKYGMEGGPSFRLCFERVSEICTEPVVERDQLLRWLIFNLLVGNADAHGKNLSLLYHADGRISVAPFYDLVCTLHYRNLHRNMTMSIGGSANPGMIGPSHFDVLARECGVSPGWLRSLVFRIADAFAQALEEELHGPDTGSPDRRRILLTIRKQTMHVWNAFRQGAHRG
jgi:serine/threonine-protein kinase HipA